MENNLTDAILHVCKVLNNASVEYMIVGGTAVPLHGYFRLSIKTSGAVSDKPDLDIWYNPTYGNYFKPLNALEGLGQDINKFKKEKAPNPKRSFFKYQVEKFTLDFLPEIKTPLRFRTAFNRKKIISLNNIDIAFISLTTYSSINKRLQGLKT